MAKNEFTVTLRIDDKGNLKQVGQKADKASKGMGKMTKETHSADRAMKGLSQQSSSGTKNFSKMAQGLTGGLVPAYATLAANIFAVTAAFRFLSDAANYRILIEGQQEWARRTGESLSLVTSRLQEATGQQLAFAEAAQSTAIARAAGVSVDQIERLGLVAKNASIALGRDLTDSVNRLIRGTTKAEPELLDELGIILRLETASKNYAAQIGKTVKELTIFEKTQAVTNEVLRQGEEKFGDFETQLNSFTKLAKAFDDLLNKIKGSLTGVAEFMAGAMSNNVLALAGGFSILGSSILRSLTPEAPQAHTGEVIKGAQSKLSKMYTGTMKPGADGRFSDKQLAKMKVYAAREKTTVFDVENYTREERRKTVQILELQNLQMEKDQAKGFTKMRLQWKLTCKSMIKEYGEVVGRLKIAQMGLMKIISWAGWAGMIATAFGILKQLVYDYTTDPETKKFHEQQANLVDKLEKQRDVLVGLNSSLVQHKNILAEINQLGKFFGNVSYGGIAQGFGTIGQVDASLMDQHVRGGGKDSLWNRGVSWYNRQDEKMRTSAKDRGDYTSAGPAPVLIQGITEAQRSIIKNTRDILQQEISFIKKVEGDPLWDNMSNKIKILSDALTAEEISDTDKVLITQVLEDLSTEGSPAAKRFASMGNSIQGVNDAILSYTNAMGGMKKANTEFSIMTNTYRDLGKGFKDIAQKLTSVADAKLKSDKIFSKTNNEWFAAKLGAKEWARIDAIDDNKEKIKELGIALAEKGEVLHQKELVYLNQAMELETNRLTLIRGKPKLLQSQINKLNKVSSIEGQINRIMDYRATLVDEGLEENAVAIAQEDAKLGKLRAQLNIAKDEASLLTELKTNMMEAFSSSLMTAIDGLIQGTVTVKEAFASMAKAVLQALAQILAKMAALAILNVMFPGMGSFGGALAAGGVIPGRGKRPRGYRSGGVVTDPTYLVGEGKYNEAVVPLPDGRSIPVQMQGGGSNVVVNVNVASDGQTTSSLTQNEGQQAAQLGRAISVAVQEELHKQRRNGGILSPYGGG